MVVDLRSSVLLLVPCRELLVDQGSEDVGVPFWSTLHQLLHLIWDVDCEKRALCASSEEALAKDPKGSLSVAGTPAIFTGRLSFRGTRRCTLKCVPIELLASLPCERSTKLQHVYW
jgi:hypothetical protein